MEPFHLSIPTSLVVFPYFQNDTAQALVFSWLQVLHEVRVMCFSALLVLFHEQRNKSLAVHLALLLFLLSFYRLSLHAFSEEEAMLLPAKPVHIPFHHPILLGNSDLHRPCQEQNCVAEC